VSIILQSTVGFSGEFMRKLPLVEQAMREHGLEPSQFVISKDRASGPYPSILEFFYDYTVFFGDDKFTVTEPNDMRFLGYFLKCVTAPDEIEPHRRDGLIRRIFRWMAQPIGTS